MSLNTLSKNLTAQSCRAFEIIIAGSLSLYPCVCLSSLLALVPADISDPETVSSSRPVFVSDLTELSSTNLWLLAVSEVELTEVLEPVSVVDCVLLPVEVDEDNDVFVVSSAFCSCEVLEFDDTCEPSVAVSVTSFCEEASEDEAELVELKSDCGDETLLLKP